MSHFLLPRSWFVDQGFSGGGGQGSGWLLAVGGIIGNVATRRQLGKLWLVERRVPTLPPLLGS